MAQQIQWNEGRYSCYPGVVEVFGQQIEVAQIGYSTRREEMMWHLRMLLPGYEKTIKKHVSLVDAKIQAQRMLDKFVKEIS